MMIQRMPLSRPFEKQEDLFWAGVHEHRHRRLAHLHRQLQEDATVEHGVDRDTTQSSIPMYYAKLPSFNCFNVMYTGTMFLGTPGQEFNVKLDTASSISWVPSERCDITCRYKWFNKYNPSTSSTYKSIDSTLPSEFVEMYPKQYSASVRDA